jgi:hypothetical protein
MSNAKLSLISSLLCTSFVLVGACAALHSSVPCPGMYCIDVALSGIPGEPSLCYKTQTELVAAKSIWQRRGYTVTDSKVKDTNVNSNSNP